MKTIKENVTTQIIEKKSKFICDLYYAQTVEKAEGILMQIRKKHYDAKHHCFAYRIQEKNVILEKASDDGEPSGTAGAPMLNLLQKQEITNVIAVVTRYFGGTLLGTGGLVRAYSQVTKEAIASSKIVTEELRTRIRSYFRLCRTFKL
ncbi:MAG: YigZ family protein [Clostridia bacterium]|nr:YigZ family protein [Clostridia bacterium]